MHLSEAPQLKQASGKISSEAVFLLSVRVCVFPICDEELSPSSAREFQAHAMSYTAGCRCTFTTTLYCSSTELSFDAVKDIQFQYELQVAVLCSLVALTWKISKTNQTAIYLNCFSSPPANHAKYLLYTVRGSTQNMAEIALQEITRNT